MGALQDDYNLIKGNPKIAMMAEGCCALAAIAAKKLNTKLRLIPPKQLSPKNNTICVNGLPSKTMNSIKLNALMVHMSKLLKMSFENIKFTGLTIA